MQYMVPARIISHMTERTELTQEFPSVSTPGCWVPHREPNHEAEEHFSASLWGEKGCKGVESDSEIHVVLFASPVLSSNKALYFEWDACI